MRRFLIPLIIGISIQAFAQSVDPLSGRAIVGIPLGSVKAYDLGINVSLNHHGGALRVDESSGNAGMGWNVDVGGYSLYREVRGLPDDIDASSRKGWIVNSDPTYKASSIQTFTSAGNDDLTDWTDESTDWTFINGFGNNDTEPDIFYFSAPGISGSFLFGSDGLPKLIPFQDLDIQFSSGNFIIKTNTGLVYNFDIKRTTQRQAKQLDNNTNPGHYTTTWNQYHVTPITFTSTWDLSSIKSTTTGQKITYTYATNAERQRPHYMRVVPESSTDNFSNQYWLTDTLTYSRLTNISLKSYNIDLSWANGLIQKVTIQDSVSDDSKVFEFIYRSIKGNVGDPPAWKPFLIQLVQQRNCNYFPPYEFKYVDINMSTYTAEVPWGTEYGQDHFGYYNGKYDNLNIPTIYFYSAESDARRLRVTPIPSGATLTKTLSGTAAGVTTAGSRNVNVTYAQIGALQTITYPTGGFTTFNYEGNKYWDSSTSEELAGPGIRVASVITGGGEETFGSAVAPGVTQYHTQKKSYEYKVSDGGNTSGKIFYPPVFAFINNADGLIYRSVDDLGPGSNLMYSRVKEIENGKGSITYGSTVYTFYMPDEYPASSTIVPKGRLARKATTTTSSSSVSKNGLYTYPFAPAKDINYKRGLLRKVIQYDANGKLLSQRSLSYSEPQASSTVKGLKYERYVASGFNFFHYSVYDIPVNQSSIVAKEITTSVTDDAPGDSVWVTKEYTYNTAKNWLTQTKQTNKDGSIVTSNVKYAGDYNVTSPAGGDLQAAAIKKMNTTNRSSTVIENWQTFTPIGGSAITTAATLNLFKDNNTYVLLDKSNVLPQGNVFTASSVSGTPQTFSYDSDYITSSTFGYEGATQVNQVDLSTIPTAVHYAVDTGLPVASFVNCKAENAVYEGFECVTSHGLTGGTTTNAARTGQKTGSLNGVTKFSSGSIEKNGNSYRISFWAKASTTGFNITTTAKNGATVQSTLALSYSAAANQWQYIEGLLNTTSVSSTFSLEISSSSAVLIDDFVALPASARVSSKTFLPLVGQTSATDDRGNSTITVYDGLGRVKEIYDRNRNLISINEYNTKVSGLPQLQAAFTYNVLSFETGSSVTFSAPANACIPGVTYAWSFQSEFGGVTTASGASVSKTFNNIGAWSITLTVSKAGYTTQSYTEKICVGGAFTSSVDISNGGAASSMTSCNTTDDGNRTYFVSNLLVGPAIITAPPNVKYDWYVTDAMDNPVTFTKIDDETINVPLPNKSYTVRCYATFTLNSVECGPMEIIGSGTKSFTYTYIPVCP